MRLSDKGLDIIKEHEGLRLEAYQDQAGVWTIGYGHANNGNGVSPSMVVTKQEAENLLRQDAMTAENAVNQQIAATLNQSQFDALVSWTFNLGSGNLWNSGLKREVNSDPSNAVIATEFKKWVYAGNRVSNGLVKRRKQESDLYFSDQKKKEILLVAIVLIVAGALGYLLWSNDLIKM
jgi:lysozyme